MQRLVLVVLVLYAIWRVLYVRGQRVARARAAREREVLDRLWASGREWPGNGGAQTVADDQLVACARCGTSVPSRRLEAGEEGQRLCEACSGAGSEQGAGHDAAR